MFGALPACKPGILDDSRIRLEARHLRDLPSPCTKCQRALFWLRQESMPAAHSSHLTCYVLQCRCLALMLP